MSNSCKQTLTLSNTAGIVENFGWGKNTLLRSSSLEQIIIYLGFYKD